MQEFFEKERTGKIIKEKRLKLSLTQAEFAKKLNVTISAVSKWETGRGMPDITLLYVIAKELGVTIDYLLGGDEPPPVDIAIKAYKNSLFKKTVKYTAIFVLVAIFIIGSSLGVYFNKEAIFYAGNSNRDCHNFAKEYLAAYNLSNEKFAEYLGFDGENIGLFLMTKFVERKNINGKLQSLKLTESKNNDGDLVFDVLFKYSDLPYSVERGLNNNQLVKTSKGWRYNYNIPEVEPCLGYCEEIVNIETRTVTIPTERENYLQSDDWAFWGIDYKSVVCYDDGGGIIESYDIFPKRFVKAFTSESIISRYFDDNELFILLSVKSENLWFRLIN